MLASNYMISDSQVEQTCDPTATSHAGWVATHRYGFKLSGRRLLLDFQGTANDERCFPQAVGSFYIKISSFKWALPPTDFASRFTVLPIQQGHRHLIGEETTEYNDWEGKVALAWRMNWISIDNQRNGWREGRPLIAISCIIWWLNCSGNSNNFPRFCFLPLPS